VTHHTSLSGIIHDVCTSTPIKFEVPSFTNSKDMIEEKNFKN